MTRDYKTRDYKTRDYETGVCPVSRSPASRVKKYVAFKYVYYLCRKFHSMKKVHFIAIGGSAMHNLAIALHRKGYEVTGSDTMLSEVQHLLHLLNAECLLMN